MTWLDSLLAEMAGHGLTPADGIEPDGAIHRFHVDGDRAGSRNGWYVAYPDERPAGAFGTWRTGERHAWRSAGSADAVDHGVQRARIRQEQQRRERDRAVTQDTTAARALDLWSKARQPNPAHAYLRGKAVGVHGIRQLGESLVVPLRDVDGELKNLQFIDPTGSKRFLRGGRVRGMFHVIGAERTPRTWLVEGYATGVSLHLDRGETVVVAFSCGNLLPVATEIQRAWRTALTIMADDDWQTPGNPGVTAAKEVAAKLGVGWHVPEFPPNRARWASDFNDCKRLWLTQRASA